jgi:2-dehydro-3-deoxyphosphogluconate aldolase/(4S)-4-hydroxy-2-oxoglutarate aldolase
MHAERAAAKPFEDLLRASRIVPVLVIQDANKAAQVGQALLDGGITIAEVTLRTPAALDAIRAMRTVNGLTVGAGTVLDSDQLRMSVEAGAQFVVSPGLRAPLVAACLGSGVDVLPGVATASDLILARDLGIGVVKYFPAEALGGVAHLSALAAPFPDMRFVPTGGINKDRAPAYLQLPFVLAVGGSWLVTREQERSSDWAGITRSAHAASELEAAPTVGRG